MTEQDTLSQISTQQTVLFEQLSAVMRAVAGRRKVPSFFVRQLHAEVATKRRNGFCPCCADAKIVGDDGLLQPDSNIDHWYSPAKNGPEETWPVCRACNMRLLQPTFKSSKTSVFYAYQQSVRLFLDKRRMQHTLFSERQC